MDNIEKFAFNPDLFRIIQLTSSQYSFYQTSYIELLDPNGKYLELIGHSVQRNQEEDNLYRLREQLSLLQSLFGNIIEQIELPPLALAGLSDLMFRMQKLSEKM
jgi:hypothetical protein